MERAPNSTSTGHFLRRVLRDDRPSAPHGTEWTMMTRRCPGRRPAYGTLRQAAFGVMWRTFARQATADDPEFLEAIENEADALFATVFSIVGSRLAACSFLYDALIAEWLRPRSQRKSGIGPDRFCPCPRSHWQQSSRAAVGHAVGGTSRAWAPARRGSQERITTSRMRTGYLANVHGGSMKCALLLELWFHRS